MTKDLREQLREADPLNREPALSTEDIHAMRRQIVLAGRAAPPQRDRVRLRVAVAVVLACTVVMGIFIATRDRSDRGPVGPVTAPRHDEPRQLQFETPGGTRIIWVLNPDLKL